MHDDPAKVAAFFKERVQQDVKQNSSRRSRDRADLEGLQFYRGGEGHQWTVWDPSAQTYVPRPSGSDDETALPEWFFRATTNRFATTVDGVCSILNQSQPAQEISPTRGQDTDRSAAEISEAALPVLLEEADYEALRPQIHKLIALTNGVAVEVYYDNDERWGMADLPLLQCQNEACRQYHLPHDVPDGAPCPDCGGEVAEAVDPRTNQPVGMPFPKGKFCLRLLTSFEFSVPRSARQLHEAQVPWIAGHSRMEAHDILTTWGAKAKTALDSITARKTSASTGRIESATYADQMRALAAPGGTADRLAPGGAVATPIGPVVWLVWADPVDDDEFYFPEGLHAVMLEDEAIITSGPLPFKDDQGRPVKNVLLRTWQATPGTAWGKPPGDDIVPLQKQLNLCVALAFLILMHDAAPTTFLPDTVTLLDELTGMPGHVVPFKSLRAGDKPIITEGRGFPESLKYFIEFIETQIDKVSKLNAVLTGARPEGDPTLGEIQIMQERGFAAFKEPLDQLVDFEKRLSMLLLWIARQCAWSPRFYSVAGENGEWDVKQFLNADLEGNVAIHVESTSAWPQSQLLLNLRLDQALQRGIINPQDPEVQAEYLSLNDLARFKKSMDADRKQIARQIDGWKNATGPEQITPPDPLWNLPLHFLHKVMWTRTEEFELLTAQRADIAGAIRQHLMAIQQLMMPAAAPAAPTGPDGKAVDQAVASGAIAPADPNAGKPDGSAVDEAVASGAIRPAGTGAAMAAFSGKGPSLVELLAQRAQSESRS